MYYYVEWLPQRGNMHLHVNSAQFFYELVKLKTTKKNLYILTKHNKDFYPYNQPGVPAWCVPLTRHSVYLRIDQNLKKSDLANGVLKTTLKMVNKTIFSPH